MVAWMLCKQSIHAMSSAEAEYYAAGDAISESLWIQELIRVLNECVTHKVETPITLVIDSKACLGMIQCDEPGAGRTKHIELKQHVILERYNEGKFRVHWVPGSVNAADLFTKTITSRSHFENLVSMIMDGREDVGECWNLHSRSIE